MIHFHASGLPAALLMLGFVLWILWESVALVRGLIQWQKTRRKG